MAWIRANKSSGGGTPSGTIEVTSSDYGKQIEIDTGLGNALKRFSVVFDSELTTTSRYTSQSTWSDSDPTRFGYSFQGVYSGSGAISALQNSGHTYYTFIKSVSNGIVTLFIPSSSGYAMNHGYWFAE